MEIERVYCFCGYAWNGKKCRSLPRQPMRGGKNFWHHPDYEPIGNHMTDGLANKPPRAGDKK